MSLTILFLSTFLASHFYEDTFIRDIDNLNENY